MSAYKPPAGDVASWSDDDILQSLPYYDKSIKKFTGILSMIIIAPTIIFPPYGIIAAAWIGYAVVSILKRNKVVTEFNTRTHLHAQ